MVFRKSFQEVHMQEIQVGTWVKGVSGKMHSANLGLTWRWGKFGQVVQIETHYGYVEYFVRLYCKCMTGIDCQDHGPASSEPVVWIFRIDGCYRGCEAERIADKFELRELQANHYSLGMTTRLTKSLTGFLRKD